MSSFIDGWENLLDASYLVDKYSGTLGQNRPISLSGGDDYYFDLKCEQDYLRAYKDCPPLKAIIGKRAKAFNTGHIDVYNINSDNKASGSEAKNIRALLDKPNTLQTRRQFFAQQNHYIDIFGYCPVLRVRPAGMDDVVSSIWNLPPWLFDLRYTGRWLYTNSIEQVYSKYYINWGGQQIEIDFKSVFFIYDDIIATDYDSNITIPDSRLVGLEYPICNTIAAYKTRNTLITKRGAIGILSNGGKDAGGVVPMDVGEKAMLQKDFSRYGLVGQPFQIIISDAALQWQQMGYATRELMLFEEIDDNVSRLCDAYGWPLELMAFALKGNFNSTDKKEAVKAAYRDTIIPEAESRLEQLSNGIVNPGSNLVVWQDFGRVEVLQEDNKTFADARMSLNNALEKEYKNGLLTKNQWLKKLGEQQISNPAFDLYYDEKPATANTGFTPQG